MRCINIYTLQPVEREVIVVIFNDSWIHDGSITMIKVIVAWKKLVENGNLVKVDSSGIGTRVF